MFCASMHLNDVSLRVYAVRFLGHCRLAQKQCYTPRVRLCA